jgi:hypothetical protein
MQKVRIVTGFREIAHEAVSRRRPVSLYTMVARTHMYTYAATVGVCPSFKDHFLSPNPIVRFATF